MAEGVYRFTNTMPATWTNWKSGEPNGKSAENCPGIEDVNPFEMYDVGCDVQMRSVCQTPLGRWRSLRDLH